MDLKEIQNLDRTDKAKVGLWNVPRNFLALQKRGRGNFMNN
jgi:hypothetical protein